MIDCSKTENYFIEKMRMTKRTRGGKDAKLNVPSVRYPVRITGHLNL